MSIHDFGRLPDGTPISEIRLANAAGSRASILTFGATLRDWQVPLPGGAQRGIVLGYAGLEGYLDNSRYLGVTAGRHASRIGGGQLPIDGVVHQLSLNAGGKHHLHGGMLGFSRRPWNILAADEASVTLGLISPDGEEGYPGTLEARCTYRLVEPSTLRIVMTATTDAPTVVSLANHSYFSLVPGETIRNHALHVSARHYLPLGADVLPTGEIRSVAGTPYDFSAARPLADPHGDPDFAYDCVFVLDRPSASPAWAASLTAPDASLRLDVHTTEPCLVLYDGAGLAPASPALDGQQHFPHAGLCLEAMRFPDNPNHGWFPSSLLRPGETYRQVTEYAVSTT
jgi:aldose 1-epimerase